MSIIYPEPPIEPPRKTFGQNVRQMWGHFSTWVAVLGTTSAAFWLQLDPLQQQAILVAVPALKLVAPVVSLVAFVVAKGIPQTPPDAR